jgi:prepilin signal peptidase PulO-like enzyme (type II secretory pathway)
MSLLLFVDLFFGFLFVSFGASLGSFLNVVFDRWALLPKSSTLRLKFQVLLYPSRCACGRDLTLLENVPIWGWLRVKGKSKCCNAKFGFHHLLVELLFGLVFYIVWYFNLKYWVFGFLN